MPTSSRRLEARANAYMEANAALIHLSQTCDDYVEAEEFERLAIRMADEYYRVKKLAKKQREKEEK